MACARDWEARRSGARRHADEARSDFEIDYARVVHSSSFRRLQGKTQILALGDDDFYRTRLTHSMEVAQVAAGVVQQLRSRCDGAGIELPLPDASLISAVGLAHDLGHPPFGHGGETALNYCMRDHGGFEGNAQTLRILTRLEAYSVDWGADLSRRTLLGVLKYPALRASAVNQEVVPRLARLPTTISVLDRGSCKPVKACYDADADLVTWMLEPFTSDDRRALQAVRVQPGAHAKCLRKSFDCSVMDVADDVAYGVHDLEDAIALRLIDADRFRSVLTPELCPTLLSALTDRPLDGGVGYDGFVAALFGEAGARKRAIGRLVHHFLRSVEVVGDDCVEEPLLSLNARLPQEPRALLDRLQQLVVSDVIENPSVQHLESKGQRMVVAVFEAMVTEPRRLLPPDVLSTLDRGSEPFRAVADYVAAMTDGALLKTYERLFSPRMGSVFDRL